MSRESKLPTWVEVLLLAAVPAVLAVCAALQVEQSIVLTIFVVVIALGIFFASYEASRPSLRQIMPTAVLGSLAAAGRILFAAIPDFKPVTAICMLAGVVFGRHSGFMVGALAALVSNFFFGQGAWTPWQMYAWGLAGYVSGVLADHGLFSKTPVVVGSGFLFALGYGFILNSWYVVGFVKPLTWESTLLAYGAGLPFDCIHGAATVVFLLALYAPWKKKLERIKRKYDLIQ